MKRHWFFLVLLLMWICSLVRAADGLQTIEFTVDGVVRKALVYVPPSAKSNPKLLVFVFHGHGGSSQSADHGFHLETEWPEAIVIYQQGLKTPGQLTDPQDERSGWQTAGDHVDRDLKFFDAMLARLKNDCNIDTRRIYATGPQ